MQGHPNAGELSQAKIRFSLDNSNDLWNPYNPTGNTKYLAERLKVDVRYGLNLSGVTEWISGGSFFLSEWNLPGNSLEASFVATNVLSFMRNEDYASDPGDTLYDQVLGVSETTWFDGFGATIMASGNLLDYPSVVPESGLSNAEVLQMCANASCCQLKMPRGFGGGLYLWPISTSYDYTIPLSLSYSHPELELSKPLKAVSVTYAGSETPYVLNVSSSGEIQTVKNSFITDSFQAEEVAEWVKNCLISRKIIKGEFRADPRLDLFDIVTVETKYGTVYPVMLTYIKYTYTGSFKANYEGRVIVMP